jgi:RNA polymerase primary sigma factor
MAEPDHLVSQGQDAAALRRMLRAAQLGDSRARERLVAAHIGLVRATASRYRNLGVPYDDLVQEGSIGLLEAIDRFDSRKSSNFQRFARFRVRRAINRALTEQSRLVRLPKHVVERRRAIDRAAAALEVATGRVATTEELAAATGLSPTSVHDARAAAVELVSLDEPILPDGSTLAAVIPDRAASDPQRDLLDRDELKRLRTGIDALPPRQRAVVVRHWGLDGKPTTTHELATELHLSSGRARTIANDALYVLRGALEPSPRTTPTAAVRRRDKHAAVARRRASAPRATRQKSSGQVRASRSST